MKNKWYLSKFFLCLVFTFSVFIIPFIVGVILLILSLKEDKENKDRWEREEVVRKEKIRQEELELQSLWDKEKSLRFADIQQKEKDTNEKIAISLAQVEKLNREKVTLSQELKNLKHEITMELIDISDYENIASDEIKNNLVLLRMKQSDLVKENKAVIVNERFLLQKKSRQNELQRQILRTFNSESTGAIESITFRNADTTRNKIQRSFEQINRLYETDGIQLSYELLESKFEELSLVYAYMVVLEEEKEVQRAIREELQEEAKVRRELEAEMKKIEKEEYRFNNEISKLMGYLQKASDVEKQLYVDKIKELEEQLKELSLVKENVLEREQNTRAGYVYIISNIGCFGEEIFKIGVTRRLEPMDRIRELSSASVPFPFDVHAMIFSHDAPALETTLHKTFDEHRVNKVNPRKEFFNVNLDTIKDIVLEHHNETVHFVTEPEALEYRETLKLA